MPRLDESYPTIVHALTNAYGALATAPDRTNAFAAVLAAALESTIDGRKISLITHGLQDAGLLKPEALAAVNPVELVALLQSVGATIHPRVARLVQKLARWWADHGRLETWQDEPTSHLREELLTLGGVGPATADAILLFGLGRAVYPVDRASYRILVRHGWLDPYAEYDEARDVLERNAAEDPSSLMRLSGWLERIGKEFCRASAPRCERCPLRSFLPEGGPLGDTA